MSEPSEAVEEQLRAAVAGESTDVDALVAALEGLPDGDARTVLGKLARELEGGVVPLLERLAAQGDKKVALAAVQGLGLIREGASASALQRLGSTLPAGDVRKAARRELHRLATLGVAPAPPEPAAEREKVRAETRWPVYRAVASPFDGRGNRGLWFGFERAGEIDMLGFLLQEEVGIRDAFTQEMSRARFDSAVAKLKADKELPWVEIPADYGRHLVQEAHAHNSTSGTALPLEYLAWRDRLGLPEERYEQPLVYRVINAAEVRWDPRFLDNSNKLLELDLIRAWAFEPDELGDLVRERAMGRRTGLVLAGVSAEARDRLVVDKAIQQLFTPRRRELLKRRLEETAYLLWKRDQGYQARVALAAGLALEPAERPLLDNPFARALVQWSLDLAEQEVEGRRARRVKPGVELYLP